MAKHVMMHFEADLSIKRKFFHQLKLKAFASRKLKVLYLYFMYEANAEVLQGAVEELRNYTGELKEADRAEQLDLREHCQQCAL